MKVKLPNEWAVSYQRFMSLVLHTNRANNLLSTESDREQERSNVRESTKNKYYLYRTDIWIIYIAFNLPNFNRTSEASVRESKCCVSRQFRTSNKAHAFEKESTFINSEHLGSY